MGVPTTTARQTPAGIKLDDGYQTVIAFAADPDVSLWEMTVQPPGLDGGDPIETSTMHNANLRTMSSRQLKTMTPMTTTAAYDPNLYNNLNALINVETSITVIFPDGSTLAFFGFLQKFDPSELKEGEMPTASITIVPTNVDPATGTEAEFVLTSAVGT